MQPQRMDPFLRPLMYVLVVLQACDILRLLADFSGRSALDTLELLLTGVSLYLLARNRLALAVTASAIVATIEVSSTFPATANHAWLEALVMWLLVSYAHTSAEADHEGERLVQELTIVVMMLTGVQKVLHGTYFQAEFFMQYLSAKDGFGILVSWLDPVGAERMKYMNTETLGSGPYSSTQPALLFLSNLAWAFEIFVPLTLLWSRWRSAGAALLIAFALAIQGAAREFTFGLLASALLATFLPQV